MTSPTKPNPAQEVRRVFIPLRPEHDGAYGGWVELNWTCPVCGGPRGEVHDARSYDGSRILYCDSWTNPCGHVDKYSAVIGEAASNGLNALGGAS